MDALQGFTNMMRGFDGPGHVRGCASIWTCVLAPRGCVRNSAMCSLRACASIRRGWLFPHVLLIFLLMWRRSPQRKVLILRKQKMQFFWKTDKCFLFKIHFFSNNCSKQGFLHKSRCVSIFFARMKNLFIFSLIRSKIQKFQIFSRKLLTTFPCPSGLQETLAKWNYKRNSSFTTDLNGSGQIFKHVHSSVNHGRQWRIKYFFTSNWMLYRSK